MSPVIAPRPAAASSWTAASDETSTVATLTSYPALLVMASASDSDRTRTKSPGPSDDTVLPASNVQREAKTAMAAAAHTRDVVRATRLNLRLESIAARCGM